MTTSLPAIELATWQVVDQTTTRTATGFTVMQNGLAVAGVLERATVGRLAAAYPVSEHDREVRLGQIPLNALTSLLREVAVSVHRADPRCRRVIFGAPEGRLEILAAAEDAGYRYVVDVDVDGGSLSLAVAEPSWVTAVDMDLDHVPQS